MSTAVAPTASAARRARLLAPMVLVGVLALLALALHLRDPHGHTWTLCPFKALTGWDCPGCGGLRAVNDLGNGHLVGAAQSNLLFVASIPLFAAGWLRWLRREWSGARRPMNPVVRNVLLVAYGVIGLGVTVFRNTPWGSQLHVS